MRKRNEKNVEEDIARSAPESGLSFEKLSAKVDWEKYRKPEAKRRRPGPRLWIPLGAATAALLCVAIAVPVVLSRQSYENSNPNHPVAGSYSLRDLSGVNIAALPFETGQRAEISAEKKSGAGCLSLSYADYAFDGSLSFPDGPLSAVSFANATPVSKSAFTADFATDGVSYSIAGNFLSGATTGLSLSITSASFEGSARLLYR